VLLVLDELQKVRGWSETLKLLWDGRGTGPEIRVLILGSSVLLMQDGLAESLAGRFFLHRCGHWEYPECRAALGWGRQKRQDIGYDPFPPLSRCQNPAGGITGDSAGGFFQQTGWGVAGVKLWGSQGRPTFFRRQLSCRANGRRVGGVLLEAVVLPLLRSYRFAP
jgi:hypothetical protein